MNLFFTILLTIIALVWIIHNIKQMIELIISIKRSPLVIILIQIILLAITYLFASIWIHYVFAFLWILGLTTDWLAQGIKSNGFLSMYRYKRNISWGEIQKVIIITSKKIKIIVSGGFMQQSFYFSKDDYEEILEQLKGNLPIESEIEIREK